MVNDGVLELRLPEQQYSNYVLMQTINDAATLALEEKRILDEMDRLAQDNEVDVDDDPGAGSVLGSSIVTVLFCSLLAVRF